MLAPLRRIVLKILAHFGGAILDFIGGAAIVAIVSSLAWMLLPREALALPDDLLLAGASLALAGATWAGVRVYADLK